MVTALVLLFARSVAETEDRLGGGAARRPASTATPPTSACASAPGASTSSLDPPLVVAVVAADGLDRHAAVRALGRLAAAERGLAGEYRGRRGPARPRRRPAGRRRTRPGRARGRPVATATVGVAAAADDLAAAYAEARRCLDTLLTLGRAGEVSDPAGLGLTRLLLGENGPEQLADFVDADARSGRGVRRGARHQPAWRPSRRGSPPAAGSRTPPRALHVHPNTVAQRLDRVGELLGRDWRDPGRGLDLQLALRVHRLRGPT